MKRLVLLVGSLFMVFNAFAQEGNGKISGTVLDAGSGQPVEFATIALNDASGKTVNGTIADAKGKFIIEKVAEGSFSVVISFIGYETITKDVKVEGRKEVSLGSIKLSEEATQLNEVVVEGQKQVVEEKVDRTIYNAENDKTTAGGDASDVLRRVPMLSVDMDGNVSMRGNSNLMVLINNKPSTISAGSVADALKQIPADQIKSVEVITSPSAKYDAEGSAGIINIITKKNTLEGATLNVDAGVGLRGSNFGLNGSYRRGKMGFNLGGFGRASYNVNGRFENEQMVSNLLTLQSGNTRRNDLNGRYTLGWDYDINDKNYMAASIRYGVRNGNNYQDDLIRETYDPINLIRRTVNDSKTVDNSGTVDASLDFTHIFDKSPHEISFSTQFSRNNRNNDFNNIFYDADGNLDSLVQNDNYNYNQEVTIQTDYQRPIGNNQNIEIGAKNITRSVYSDFSYFGAGSDGVLMPIDRSSLSNSLNYDQNVSAGYFSYTLSGKMGYSLKAGGRYEYTTINASYREGSELPDPQIPSYGTFVPSVNASKKLKNGTTIKASYNRRIQRPSIRFLNPNIQASNPLNISVGNPDLDPEFTNNYELAYSTFVKGTTLNFSAFVRNTTGSIQSIRTPLGGDTILTSYANIGKEDAYGGSIFANVTIGQKLTLNGSTDVFYAVLDNKLTDPLFAASNEGWVISGRMFGNYKFNKKWTGQMFGFYRGRSVQLQGTQGGFGMYSIGIRREFNNGKGSFGFAAENFVTSSIKVRSTLETPTISQKSVNEMRNMSFRINISYRIGKMSFDGNRRRGGRSVNNDDLKSEGGGDGGMDMGNGGGGGAQRQGGGNFQGQGQRPQNQANQVKADTTQVDPNAVVKADGTWTYSVETAQGTNGGTLKIVKDGESYSGTIINSRFNRETVLKEVKVNGNELSFTYEMTFGANTAVISAKGTIAGDQFTGSMSMGQFGSFPMTAKRSGE